MINTATLVLPNSPTIALPYNPNNTLWNYELNRQVMDTYGGRVIQILSVSTQQMTMTGDAGSRKKLLYFFSELKKMQVNQIEQQCAAILTIPATFAENGKITQSVYIDTVNLGIDYSTVTYPYNIIFQVEDNSASDVLVSNSLKEIASAFNYSPGVGNTITGKLSLLYQGLNTVSQLSIAAAGNQFANPDYTAKYLTTPPPNVGNSYNV